ncbi:MAG: flagellar biosynthesis repressor FlbT [Ferrovibrio sp.]
MPLRIDVKAGEKFTLNNSKMHLTKSSALIIEDRVVFLRDRDKLSAEQASTAAKRIYYACQQMYIDERNFDYHYILFKASCMSFAEAAPSFGPLLLNLGALIANGQYLKALRVSRHLVELEESLSTVPEGELLDRVFREAASYALQD